MTTLTTAPIDTFEAIARAAASDPERMALVATALAHSVPLVELHSLSSPGIGPPDARLQDPLLVEALDAGFEAFCLYAAPRWKELRDLCDHLLRSMVKLKPENSHPLVRLLRNHWFWLWYEMLHTARAWRAESSSPIEIRYLEQCPLLIGGKFIPGRHDCANLLMGPVLITSADLMEGSAETAIDGLLNAIERGWRKIRAEDRPPTLQRRSGGKFPLYTSAFLSRAAAARPRKSWDDLDTVASQVVPQLEQIKKVSSEKLSLGPYRSVFRVAAAITAFGQKHGTGLVSHDHTLRLDTPADYPESRLAPDNIEVRLDYPGNRKPDREILEAAKDQGAKIGAAWRSYTYDCNTILAPWLRHSLWERVAHADETGDWGVLGSRATRFLANAFLANECTIYQVNYAHETPDLVRIGGCSDDRNGVEKSAMFRKFMLELPKQERINSIYYRAMMENALQYVPFEHPDTPKAARQIAFPENTEWDMRGRSAIALPIRVNGMVWGVVGLISFNFDHFPFNVRVQVGELVDTIGSALSFQSVSEMLNHIDKIISDGNPNLVLKRNQIVQTLPKYFMSSDVSLIRFRAGPSDGLEYTAVATTGSHPAFTSATDIARLLETEFDNMMRHSFPVMTNVPLDDTPSPLETDTNGASIILLPHAEDKMPDGAVVLRIALPIRPEAGWHQPLQVLGQYLLNAIDALDNEINWARHRRYQYGHEMVRNIDTIDDVESRIEPLMRPYLERENIGSEIRLLLNDLDRSKRSLRLYAEALTDSTLAIDSTEDPRISAMIRHLNKRATATRMPIDVRDTYHAAIYSRRAEAREARVKFFPFPNFDCPKVKIDDVLLFDVVSTLVDNAIKYSLPGYPVALQPRIGATFDVALTNLGPVLSPDEETRIFQDEYRGLFAKTHFPQGGRGLGLGYARSLMELAGGDLTYRQRFTEKRNQKIGDFEVTWHHFTVTFPRRTGKNAG